MIPRLLLLSSLLLASAGCARLRHGGVELPPPHREPLGSVMVDAGRREVVITGFVNQVSGLVELLACGPAGKTHESVLVLMARPHDIQMALLLLGVKHGPPMPGVGVAPPQGDELEIDVEWTQDGTVRRVPAEKLLWDRQRKKALKHEAWIFNGSMVVDGRLKAMEEETYVATYWDPWGIINLKSAVGADDERVAVNSDTVPPLHAPVTVILRPVEAR